MATKFNDYVEDTGNVSLEDTTCQVDCVCGADGNLWVSDSEIVRCPDCERGYQVEFVVWVYEPGEEA